MNIAIIGYGVVGGGVHALLKDGKHGINVRRVLDKRPIKELGALLTDNIGEIISDPRIDCVVEAMGGVHPALSYVTAALRGGKHVVTSNKELVSHALAPLVEGAAVHAVSLRFTASVGGGVPWLRNLLLVKRADTLQSIYGVVNGTTNYILDAMGHGLALSEALLDAQRLGYAEVDASIDLDGIDSQRKCAISAALAFDSVVEVDDVQTLGMRNVTAEDIQAFASRGLVCKLMMYASRLDRGVCAYVEPTLLGPDTLAAHVPTNHNCIHLCGDHVGNLAFFGQGAGRYPTAVNIVQDLLDIKEGHAIQSRAIQPLPVRNEEERHPYYVRTTARERIAGIQYEALGGGWLTRDVSVKEMHGLAAELLKEDKGAFIAGVER